MQHDTCVVKNISCSTQKGSSHRLCTHSSGAHLHLGGQRLALLGDIVQDDMCILHVFSFTLPLRHITLQSKNAH